MDVKGKRVTVIGFGRSGLSAAKLLYDKGAEVTVTDCLGKDELRQQIAKLKGRDVKFYLGDDGLEAIENAEIAVVSPGVPADAPSFQLAEKRKIPVISEIELFSWYCDLPVVAVTGTNGKTTTATLIAGLLQKLGYRTRLAGNIGFPLTGLVGQLNRDENVVAEISSFQLEHIEKFHPYVSIILNITPDHLDRYENFQDYVLAKSRIFANQGRDDFSVLNADDAEVARLARGTEATVVHYSRNRILKEGVFVDSGNIVTCWRGNVKKVCSTQDIKMKGSHNLENCLAAVAVGLIYGSVAKKVSDWAGAVRDTVSEFGGLEHRLEYVRTINGINFFNDSKATNVGAVVEALRSFACPVVLICGGRDKGSDYSVLGDAARAKVKSAILFGEAREKLRAALGRTVPCVEAKSFHSVFRTAFSAASPGDVVLLSPACSSFDMFTDFEERGEIFKAEIENLWKDS